ncbi:ricin-type beta-trefoil lectin domain protein [Streptomyces sp. NPDC059176]|uniref:ricin-type beta-trefoil lectin domain protein n=1 Tax=unclassified Streptomyces TaxID=2593676 RepID=UPI003687AF79
MSEQEPAEVAFVFDQREYAEQTDTQLAEHMRERAPASLPAAEEFRRRHLPAVLSYAWLFARNRDARDRLAATAFDLAVEEASRGVDPPGTWRHHLLTLVQRTAEEWAGGERRRLLDVDFLRWWDDERRRDDEVPTLFRAFCRLPERTRVTLWYCVVEQESEASTSVYAGIDRDHMEDAREKALASLRQAFVEAHFERGSPACEAYGRLVDAAAQPRAARRSRDLGRHLDTCPSCAQALAELTRFSERPRTALAQGLLRWGGAAYVAAGPVPVATESPTGSGEPQAAASGAGPAPDPPVSSTDTDADAPGGKAGRWRVPPGYVVPAVIAFTVLGIVALILSALTTGSADSEQAGHATATPPTLPLPQPTHPQSTVTATVTASSPSTHPPRPAMSPKRQHPMPPTTTGPRPSPTHTAEAPPRPPAPKLPGADPAPVVNVSSGLCLDIDGFGFDVQMARCSGSRTQLWYVDRLGQLRNGGDPSDCLDAQGGVNFALGTWPCADAGGLTRSDLLFDIDGNGAIRPVNAPDLAVTPDHGRPGSELHLQRLQGRAEQRWTAGPAQ